MENEESMMSYEGDGGEASHGLEDSYIKCVVTCRTWHQVLSCDVRGPNIILLSSMCAREHLLGPGTMLGP